MPSAYERAILKQRADLLRLDNAAMYDLRRAYEAASARLTADLDRVVDGLLDGGYPEGVSSRLGLPLFDASGTFTARGAAEFRAQRLASLQRQVNHELRTVADRTYGITTTSQRAALGMGQDQANDLLQRGAVRMGVAFDALPREAFETAVGLTREGTPLRDLLDERAGAAAQEAATLLRDAVAVGQNPRAIAPALAHLLNTERWKAQRIARNTILDAHRDAAIDTYAKHADIVRGWAWCASLGARTCLVCLGLHGREFPLTTRFMGRHSQCRCSPVPIVDGMNPLGSGEDWLRGQPRAVQHGRIPKALRPDWDASRVRLVDFVQPTSDPTWGPGYKQAPIALVQANAALRRGDPLPQGPATAPGAQGTLRSPSGLSYDPARPPQPILDAEGRMRPQRYESAYAFDRDGNEVLRKDGAQYSVSFTDAETLALKDTLLTHNHPRGWDWPATDPRRAGNSFSDSDLFMAASETDMAAIRAVTPTTVYTLERPAHGWRPQMLGGGPIPRDELQRHLESADREVRNAFVTAINRGQMTPAEAEARHYHEKLLRVSQRLGWHYTVQEAP